MPLFLFKLESLGILEIPVSWLQLFLEVDKEHADPISDWLSEQGAQAITLEDAQDKPIFEPAPGETPLWDTLILIALFNKDDDIKHIFNQADKQFPGIIKKHKIKVLEDQNWERAWMKDFQAMQFGHKLWICPSWQTPPDPDAINIMLDPGLAFGSGTHETTALCLRWLESLSLSNKTLIDYGCGSGILAIAAVKLGAKHVLGTDTDPQAVIASRENASRNSVSEQQFELLKVSTNTQANIATRDILIANILAEPLRILAPYLASLVRPDGQIGLSGLLTTQAEEIRQLYSQWFTMSPVISDGDWSFVSGIKKNL